MHLRKIYELQIILFAVPWCCLAQFSIQGPSDGNRQAQGLKYSADKGIEYTDKSGNYLFFNSLNYRNP